MVTHADSVLAVNLKACNTFRLTSGKDAEAELLQLKATASSSLLDHDLVRHNMVVFRGGGHALRELQPLLKSVPEARLNLVIYNLRKGSVQEAFDLVRDLEPSLPQVRGVWTLLCCRHSCIRYGISESEYSQFL
jgi:intraflagellar transport protein 56